ncbi:unnamed protein product [Didymodactylos carnosus]|uniref:Uncharacterized protein n=1 Tax=Didymodactylos carnosus TaxID=1234261 RepID=A0A815B3I0_9BILA|nr:unnamed protein product [Didymodactylos carnosus]CAF1263790.1 unnamed protein product [Didymodactylos carnosus]CAF3830570.1 unnamed protein product [Didymodactylos carnosus]CAF4044077.1 unnamed protein product [Didymodactylos carnosus]
MTDSVAVPVPIPTPFVNNFFTLTHQFYADHRSAILIATGTVLTGWLYNLLWVNRRLSSSSTLMTNKTVVITGGSSGIGYETAKDLARRGARLIIVSRNPKKGQAAVAKLRDKSGNKQIEFMQCDLCSLDSVKNFCNAYNEKESRLDVLINNAGILFGLDVVTKDGYNSIVQANYLGHFLLTNLLLDKLKQCKPSRIINVSSSIHSKDPLYGAVGLLRFVIFYPLLYLAKTFFAKTSKRGAQTIIYCAVASELINSNEIYFENCSPQQPNQICLDAQNIDRLWKASCEAVGL